ncbi:MAG: hypothetical protein WC058_07040 [Phycisphaeraceae bacterium]
MRDDPLTETLNTPPSWTNRARRVDRSACLVLRTRDVKHAYRGPNITLTARDLRYLFHHQLPLQTAGDHCTHKSNAIKRRFQRGLFLPQNWSQSLRIERHKLHARLTQYFLVCPGCGPASSNHKSKITNQKSNLPGASLPGRCLKLYLPLCTSAEWRDGTIVRMVLSHAAPWSLGLPSKSLHPVMPPELVTKLIHRYHPLLFRGLLCRQCLGLRYGESQRTPAAQHPLAPDWAKDKPDYYQSLTPDQRAKVSELFNLFRGTREYRQRQQQKMDRLERRIATLERKYPGTKFR